MSNGSPPTASEKLPSAHYDRLETLLKNLPGMAYPYYASISDEDLDAIIVYLRSVPPSP